MLLLRNRTDSSKLKVVRLDTHCLIGGQDCAPKVIAVLPESLRQVLALNWTPDGSRAFFWDPVTSNVYTLDSASRAINKLREGVKKIRGDFFISPDGAQMVFEMDAGPFATDLVAMNMNSGDIQKLNIALPGMKFVSAWLTDQTFLFWRETYSGDKGYLAGIDVYTFDTQSQVLRPFEIGRVWLKASVPKFSPDGQAMLFHQDGKIILRQAATGEETLLNVNPEAYLWSPDSKEFAIYSQSKEIYSAGLDGQDVTQEYTLPGNRLLTGWLWLPGEAGAVLMVTSDEDGNTELLTLSTASHSVTPISIAGLSDDNIIALSYLAHQN